MRVCAHVYRDVCVFMCVCVCAFACTCVHICRRQAAAQVGSCKEAAQLQVRSLRVPVVDEIKVVLCRAPEGGPPADHCSCLCVPHLPPTVCPLRTHTHTHICAHA